MLAGTLWGFLLDLWEESFAQDIWEYVMDMGMKRGVQSLVPG